MNYKEILTDIADGKIENYEVKPEEAFKFQEILRNFGRRQEITGIAERGGKILYKKVENKN